MQIKDFTKRVFNNEVVYKCKKTNALFSLDKTETKKERRYCVYEFPQYKMPQAGFEFLSEAIEYIESFVSPQKALF